MPVDFHAQYNKDKEYELTDFLPPKIQALSNLRNLGTVSVAVPYEFQNIGTSFLGGNFQEEIHFDTNCWGTVHDILLSESKPLEINFYSSQDKTIKYFTDSAYFDKVETFAVEMNPKQDSFFESCQLKSQVFFDKESGRYKIDTRTFPGDQYVPALEKRPSF